MTTKPENKNIIAILGSTASGKTSVALKVAQKLDGVIINCDSRQIYKNMLIGTASPSEKEKSLIEHRLFNFLSPEKQYNAADYAKAAANAIKEIWNKNKFPILTGGTGFYYSAISEGLGEAGSNKELANELQKDLETLGLEHMVERLKKLDFEASVKIDTSNPRRVLRALEVVLTTGKAFSQNEQKALLSEGIFLPIVVSRPREILHGRIEARVDQMLQSNLESEVINIIEKYGRKAPGLASIGYREWFDYFDGKISKTELRQLIIIHTRQYAKRQETWFRKKPGVPFIDLEDIRGLEDIFDKIKGFQQ